MLVENHLAEGKKLLFTIKDVEASPGKIDLQIEKDVDGRTDRVYTRTTKDSEQVDRGFYLDASTAAILKQTVDKALEYLATPPEALYKLKEDVRKVFGKEPYESYLNLVCLSETLELLSAYGTNEYITMFTKEEFEKLIPVGHPLHGLMERVEEV